MIRWVAAGAVLVGLGLWFLAPFPSSVQPVLPDLEGIEGDVVELVVKRHEALLDDPSWRNWARYARTLHAHDMGTEAHDAYLVAASSAPQEERFELLYLAGHSMLFSDPDTARIRFEAALELRSDYPALELHLGELHEQARRFAEARQHYGRALALQESSHAYLGLGRVALLERNTDEALSHLETAAALDPDHHEVHAALARVHSVLGRDEEARRSAQRAGNLARSTNFADPILMRMAQEGVSYASLMAAAIAHIKAGSFSSALEAADRALQIDPGGLQALFQRGRILASLQRFDEAIVSFDRVLGQQPDATDSLVLKSACLISLGRSREAVGPLTRALELDPENVNARFSLATLIRDSRPDLAEAHLRYVIRERPGLVDPRMALATLYMSQGHLEPARLELEQVLAVVPQHAGARKLLQQISR